VWLVVENVDDVGQELEKRVSQSPTTTTSPATYQKSFEALANCKNKREREREEEEEKEEKVEDVGRRVWFVRRWS